MRRDKPPWKARGEEPTSLYTFGTEQAWWEGKKKFSTLEKGNMNYCLSPSTKSSASALLTTTTALLFRSYLTP